MNRNLRVSLILVTLLVVALGAFLFTTNVNLLFQRPFEGPRPPISIPGDIELYYMIQTVLSTINLALLIILLITYIDMYTRIKSEFTIGLIIFSSVLLLNSLTSNPLLHLGFGFREFGLGPFAVLPELFTLSALIVLLYLTFKY